MTVSCMWNNWQIQCQMSFREEKPVEAQFTKKSLVPNTVAIYEVYKSSHEDSVSKVIIEKICRYQIHQNKNKLKKN